MMQISTWSQRVALNCYIGVIEYAESDFHISRFDRNNAKSGSLLRVENGWNECF